MSARDQAVRALRAALDAPGLLTGADGSRESYRAAADANADHADLLQPERAAAWASRDLDRLQFDGTFGSRI